MRSEKTNLTRKRLTRCGNDDEEQRINMQLQTYLQVEAS